MANHSSDLPKFGYEYFHGFSGTLADPYSTWDWKFEIDDFNPESEDIWASMAMPQTDSGYYSSINSINPYSMEDRNWNNLSFSDDGMPLECESAPIPSRPQAESSDSPNKAYWSTSSFSSSRAQPHNSTLSEREAAFACRYNRKKYQESRDAAETATSNDKPKPSSTSGRPKPYACVFPECEAVFSRPYDLGRHQQSLHFNSKRFDCPLEDCRRYGIPGGTERGGFTRLDHFRDHVKNLHGQIVIKDKDSNGGQYWVLDPQKGDGELWMRDETGSIRTKDRLGRIRVKDAKTGRWQQIP